LAYTVKSLMYLEPTTAEPCLSIQRCHVWLG